MYQLNISCFRVDNLNLFVRFPKRSVFFLIQNLVIPVFYFLRFIFFQSFAVYYGLRNLNRKTFVPQKKSGGVKIEEAAAADAAAKLVAMLSDAKII